MELKDEYSVRPCVGCGFCCRKAPCGAALRIYGPVEACPALEYREGRYYCKLCELPGDLGAAYRKELYVGAGCCCGLNSDRQNIPAPPPKVVENPISSDCQHLLTAIGREPFIGGDQIYLLITSASRFLGKQWEKEAFHIIQGSRRRMSDEFMGKIPNSVGADTKKEPDK